MASIGINVPRDGSAHVDVLHSLGATWIRIVAMPDVDLSEYFKRCRSAGIKIMLVLARESGGDYARYQRLYSSLVDCVQPGNEPDHVSPSSWTMTQAEFVALGKATRKIFPAMPIVTAGLASGQPSWLAGLDLSWADALGIHPYGKSPDPQWPHPGWGTGFMGDLLDGYATYGKPLLVTELGLSTDQVTPDFQADYLGRCGGYLNHREDVEAWLWFCLDDARMVPQFGLMRSEGDEKPAANAFRAQAASAIHSLWPNVREPGPLPEPEKPDPWQFFTAEQIAAACRIPPTYRANVAASWPKIMEQIDLCGINDRPTQVAMAATVAIETARRFLPIHEFRNADGSIPSYWHGYDGGAEFHGRGFIQNTHRYNYRALGPKIAELWGAGPDDPTFDLVAHPDNLLDPDMSAAAAAIYFRDRNISAMAQRRDWAAVRRAVQGQAAPPDSIESVRRDAEALWALGAPAPPPPADPAAEYLVALKTIRDVTIPAIRAQVDELDRIVKQFAGVD